MCSFANRNVCTSLLLVLLLCFRYFLHFRVHNLNCRVIKVSLRKSLFLFEIKVTLSTSDCLYSIGARSQSWCWVQPRFCELRAGQYEAKFWSSSQNCHFARTFVRSRNTCLTVFNSWRCLWIASDLKCHFLDCLSRPDCSAVLKHKKY